MTSKQVMLSLVMVVLVTGGCLNRRGDLTPDYPDRQLWAVVPLRNESGSLHADGLTVADHLAHQLEDAYRVDVLPVNRTIGAMEALELHRVATMEDAMQLRSAMQVDAIVIGSITAYDPYDPPKLGLLVELYVDPLRDMSSLDLRKLQRTPTDDLSLPSPARRSDQPVSTVSVYYDAADPHIRHLLERYGNRRGPDGSDRHAWRRYRMSMDLYTEFVCHEVSARLLRAEAMRLKPPPEADRQVKSEPAS